MSILIKYHISMTFWCGTSQACTHKEETRRYNKKFDISEMRGGRFTSHFTQTDSTYIFGQGQFSMLAGVDCASSPNKIQKWKRDVHTHARCFTLLEHRTLDLCQRRCRSHQPPHYNELAVSPYLCQRRASWIAVRGWEQHPSAASSSNSSL